MNDNSVQEWGEIDATSNCSKEEKHVINDNYTTRFNK